MELCEEYFPEIKEAKLTKHPTLIQPEVLSVASGEDNLSKHSLM